MQDGASSSPNANSGISPAYLHAEKTALRLIARAEQCTNGLTRKLKRRGYEEDCISAVISRLLELKLIDDGRYARLWLQSRLRLTRSPRRLLAALCAKGIEREDAQTALNAALDEETEFALITRYAGKLARRAQKKGEDAAASLKYMLKNEGFSPKAVSRFLGEES